MEKILISSKPISSEQYKNYKEAKWMISELDAWDLNGRFMSKEVGEKCHKSIIGYPIVAKLITDKKGNPVDFGGHEVTKKKDSEGNISYKFNTVPIGSILDSNIETVDGKECIVISTKLWSDRFPEYFTVLDKLWEDGKVSSSWELAVNEWEETDEGKILKDVEFLGNCILGSTVEGAVPGAGMLEYAEINNDEIALASALRNDIDKNNEVGEKMNENENITKANENPENITAENDENVNPDNVSKKNVNADNTNKDNKQTSALTSYDIEIKLESLVCKDGYGYPSYIFPEEHYALCRSWKDNSLDYTKVNYSVSDNDVEIISTEKVSLVIEVKDINTFVAEKNDAIIKMDSEIAEFKAKVESLEKDSAELAEIKKQNEEAELKKKQDEVAEYAKSSGYFTDEEMASDEFKNLIAEADINSVKAIIADKCVAERKNSATIEVSEKINVNNVESTSFSMAAYLRR